MPGRRLKDRTFSDSCFPVNAETRQMLEERVIGEYRKLIGGPMMPRAVRVWLRV
jgi:DNA-binding cell septation regulator SpoVG